MTKLFCTMAMNLRVRALTALAFAGGLAWAGAASASPIVQHADGIIIRSNLEVSFQSTVDFDDDPQVLFGNPLPNGSDVASSTASVSPTSGEGTASGTVTFQFDYTVGLHDFFTFSGDITLSALTAFNFEGFPASAEAEATGSAAFFFPVGLGNHPVTGFPTELDDVIGTLTINSTGSLQTWELERTIEVRRDAESANVVEALVEAGDPAAVVNLLVGHQYNVNVIYRATVLHGNDPDFSFSMGGGTLAIPEPSTFALGILCLVTGALLLRD